MTDKRYLIQYDREGCIGAAACAVASAEWSIVADGKADLKDMKKSGETDFCERTINEGELEQHMAAAKSCPVNVIHVVDLQTKEKLI